MNDPVMDEQAFKEWLNDRRMYDVSYVFHEIVAKYRAALASKPLVLVDEVVLPPLPKILMLISDEMQHEIHSMMKDYARLALENINKTSAVTQNQQADEISVERIVELIDASKFVYPESGHEGFDQLGFARLVEKETKLTCSDDWSIPGWQYVPVDPIDEMRAACKHLQYSDQIDEDWAAMLAKAPSPPKKAKQ